MPSPIKQPRNRKFSSPSHSPFLNQVLPKPIRPPGRMWLEHCRTVRDAFLAICVVIPEPSLPLKICLVLNSWCSKRRMYSNGNDWLIKILQYFLAFTRDPCSVKFIRVELQRLNIFVIQVNTSK